MEAVIFCGIQGSGKSSFYRERFFRTHVRINLDMLRTRRREEILLRACIEGKTPFVIDNTNPTLADRERYISLAKSASFRVNGFYFASKIEEALRRNATRSGAERIPERGVRSTHGRLRVPTRDEGFDLLHYVRLDESGFTVEEWRDEVR